VQLRLPYPIGTTKPRIENAVLTTKYRGKISTIVVGMRKKRDYRCEKKIKMLTLIAFLG
jgi:hypothetical protein